MIVSIYLHEDIVESLKYYGKNLSEVTNKILQEYSSGKIDIMDKPSCRTREGASRYDISVTNQDYLALAELYPPNSTHISLRRLLYWFAENEIYNDLGWEPVDLDSAYKIIYNTHLEAAMKRIQCASKYANSKVLAAINKELESLKYVD